MTPSAAQTYGGSPTYAFTATGLRNGEPASVLGDSLTGCTTSLGSTASAGVHTGAVTGCITPNSAKDYYVFNKETRWRMPGAKVDIDLKFVQDWIGAYKNSENIGLVPKEGGGPETTIVAVWSDS